MIHTYGTNKTRKEKIEEREFHLCGEEFWYSYTRIIKLRTLYFLNKHRHLYVRRLENSTGSDWKFFFFWKKFGKKKEPMKTGQHYCYQRIFGICGTVRYQYRTIAIRNHHIYIVRVDTVPVPMLNRCNF